jgi:transposase
VLSDEVWARIEPLLPAQYGKGRPFRDHRQVIEGIVFRYRCGIAWRDLPERFGPWQTVWKRHHRFSTDGTWDEVLAILQAEADAAGEIDWRVSVDSTTSRVHQHGATAARSSEGPSSYTGGELESQETITARRPAGAVAPVGAVAAGSAPR